MAAFSDLCVPVCDNTSDILSQAIKLGYGCAGLNIILTDLKGKGSQVVVPSPRKFKLRNEDIKFMEKTNRSFHQLSRITATVDDPSQTHKLGSAEVQAYDLVAVEPTSEKAFHLACSVLNVDIIAVDMRDRVPYFFKKPSVKMAIERGLHFEIKYSPTIRDSTLRRNIISSAISLAEVSNGKNIILSSDCEKAIELRGPYDVVNLGLMFGLTHETAKNTVAKNCRAVLRHAESRKITKSVIAISSISNTSTDKKQKKSNGTGDVHAIEEDINEPVEKKRKKKKQK